MSSPNSHGSPGEIGGSPTGATGNTVDNRTETVFTDDMTTKHIAEAQERTRRLHNERITAAETALHRVWELLDLLDAPDATDAERSAWLEELYGLADEHAGTPVEAAVRAYR